MKNVEFTLCRQQAAAPISRCLVHIVEERNFVREINLVLASKECKCILDVYANFHRKVTTKKKKCEIASTMCDVT